MYCKQCGTILPEGVEKCLKCNTKVGKGQRYCEKCGNIRKNGDLICSKCGNNFQSAEGNIKTSKNAQKTDTQVKNIKGEDDEAKQPAKGFDNFQSDQNIPAPDMYVSPVMKRILKKDETNTSVNQKEKIADSDVFRKMYDNTMKKQKEREEEEKKLERQEQERKKELENLRHGIANNKKSDFCKDAAPNEENKTLPPDNPDSNKNTSKFGETKRQKKRREKREEKQKEQKIPKAFGYGTTSTGADNENTAKTKKQNTSSGTAAIVGFVLEICAIFHIFNINQNKTVFILSAVLAVTGFIASLAGRKGTFKFLANAGIWLFIVAVICLIIPYAQI